MAKVDIDLIKKVLHRNEIDAEIISQVMEELELEIQVNEKGEVALTPPVKKQYVMLISDPEGKLEEQLFTGWILQIPEDLSPLEVNAQLIRAAYEYNQSKRGQREPAKTITDVCEIVPQKFLKAQNVWVKTKEPILLVHTDNIVPLLPTSESQKEVDGRYED